eukprot:294006-Rhodomonas_salina.2
MPSEQRCDRYRACGAVDHDRDNCIHHCNDENAAAAADARAGAGVRVICQNKIIYDSSDKAHELTLVSPQNNTIPLPEILCFGDTELAFFRHSNKGNRRDRKKDFYACFHTAFHEGDGAIEFGNEEVDWVGKDAVKHYPASLKYDPALRPRMRRARCLGLT